MEQENYSTQFSARKRLPGACSGRGVQTRHAGFEPAAGSDRLFGRVRDRHGDYFFGRRRLPRTSGGAGLRGGHPYRHHCRGRGQPRRPQEHARTERHHPVDRFHVGRDRRRGDLYVAGALHSGTRGPFLSDFPFVAVRRAARYPAAHPVPEIFRQGHARQVPVPRGYGHDRGARLRREERQSGQVAGRERTGRWTVRFRRRNVRLVDRGDIDPHRDMGDPAGRQDEARLQDQHRRGRAGAGLHRGT